MVLGAFLGILATVVYYQFARFCQEYRHSRMQRIGDAENLPPVRSLSSLEDPNKYLFRAAKTFKEDSE